MLDSSVDEFQFSCFSIFSEIFLNIQLNFLQKFRINNNSFLIELLPTNQLTFDFVLSINLNISHENKSGINIAELFSVLNVFIPVSIIILS